MSEVVLFGIWTLVQYIDIGARKLFIAPKLGREVGQVGTGLTRASSGTEDTGTRRSVDGTNASVSPVRILLKVLVFCALENMPQLWH